MDENIIPSPAFDGEILADLLRLPTPLHHEYRHGEGSVVTRILRLENFEDEIRALESEFSLPRAPIEEIVQSGHHRVQSAQSEGSFADMMIYPGLWQLHSTPGYDAFYDSATRDLASTIFRDDFAHYGYAQVS